jgi:hypothetical protein
MVHSTSSFTHAPAFQAASLSYSLQITSFAILAILLVALPVIRRVTLLTPLIIR